MTRKPEHDQVTGLSMEDKTMTDECNFDSRVNRGEDKMKNDELLPCPFDMDVLQKAINKLPSGIVLDYISWLEEQNRQNTPQSSEAGVTYPCQSLYNRDKAFNALQELYEIADGSSNKTGIEGRLYKDVLRYGIDGVRKPQKLSEVECPYCKTPEQIAKCGVINKTRKGQNDD